MWSHINYINTMMMLERQLKELVGESRQEHYARKEESKLPRKMSQEIKRENTEANIKQAKPDYAELRRQCPNLFDDIGVDFSEFDD